MWQTWPFETNRIPHNYEKCCKRNLLHLIHDKPTAAHVGQDWMIYTAKRVAWWPAMSKWVENYVKGCAKCQQNKALMHRTTIPPYKIDVPPLAQPFKVVAMDLITQLPNSHGYNAILTIVDHGCTRAALFLPCTTNDIALPLAPEVTSSYVTIWVRVGVNRAWALYDTVVSSTFCLFPLHSGRCSTIFRQFLLCSVRFQYFPCSVDAPQPRQHAVKRA